MAQTGTAVGTEQVRYRVLGIYLNDHLAGATIEIERRRTGWREPIVRPGQAASSNTWRPRSRRTRAALIAMMKALGIPVRAYKVYAA